jgi:prephenate dehydrogenase
MKIGIIGAGHIWGNCAERFVAGGHEVMLSFSRDPDSPARLRDGLGDGASVGSPRDAVGFAELVVLSVPRSPPSQPARRCPPRPATDPTHRSAQGETPWQSRSTSPAGASAS